MGGGYPHPDSKTTLTRDTLAVFIGVGNCHGEYSLCFFSLFLSPCLLIPISRQVSRYFGMGAG